MPDDLLLPEGARLVHIGPHKTGSTAVQVALFGARDELRRHGVYYPSKLRRRRFASEELFAAHKHGSLHGPLQRWDALAAEVAAAGASRVCVSDELFGKAEPPVVAKIVRDLGGEAVHVVAVVRPLQSYLPSQYQERVKAGRPFTYEDWLRIVLGGDRSRHEHRNVWHAHDPGALVERWLEHVTPDRFTLVVADESDRRQLTRIFARLLGVPPELLEATPRESNQSLALGEVELLRVAGEALVQQGIPARDFQPWLKHVVYAASEHVGDRPGRRRPPLPPWAVSLVEEASEARVEAVKGLPVRVVGEPDRLRFDRLEEPDVDPTELRVTSELGGVVVARVIAAALRG